MFFTKQADGFRAWFTIVEKGVPVPGISSSAFTISVRDPADSVTNSPSVTESGIGGLYYFDIPSAFITTNGIGSYAVLVEVDSTVQPKVTDAMSEVLRVSQVDVDIVAGLMYRNSFLDSTTHNANGHLLTGRVRLFDTSANAAAATDGGSGETGEIASFDITAVAETTDGRLTKTYRMIQTSP